MGPVIFENVKYYLQPSGCYFVGNGSEGSGIISIDYEGEITIQSQINGKEITEISHEAFLNCRYITKVMIHAKIKKINDNAFNWCDNLTYINIPPTVTHIGVAAIRSSVSLPTPILIEFCKGRIDDLYINSWCFANRKTVHIIYPSSIIPSYNNKMAFDGVVEAFICAPSVFDFYTKTTTTDLSKCPLPEYEELVHEYRVAVSKRKSNESNLLVGSSVVILTESDEHKDKSDNKLYKKKHKEIINEMKNDSTK